MTVVKTWIGVKSTLGFIQTSSCHSCSGEVMTAAVTVDDFVGVKLRELKE